MSILCRLMHRCHWRDRLEGFVFACDKCGREWRDSSRAPVNADDIGDDSLIPVFVINLKDATSRHEHMTREMAKAKIPFAFIEAIRGSDITHTIGTATRNVTASSLSHLHAIKLIAEGEHDFGAVFEDDVLISPDAKLFLDSRVLRTLPRFDIIQLMFLTKEHAGDARAEGLSVNIAKISSNYTVCTRPRPSLGMQGLIYQKTAAQRILREITEIPCHLDDMLFRRTDVFGLRVAAVSPPVVAHGDFQSTIAPPQRPNPQGKIVREFNRAVTQLRRHASFAVAWVGR